MVNCLLSKLNKTLLIFLVFYKLLSIYNVSIKNCLIYNSQNNVCSKCNKEYFLTDNNYYCLKCDQYIESCIECSSNKLCSSCNYDYILINILNQNSSINLASDSDNYELKNNLKLYVQSIIENTHNTDNESIETMCMHCTTAIEKNLCKKDCSNNLCKPCSNKVLKDNKINYTCKNYSSKSNIVIYYSVIGGTLFLIYGFYPNKKRTMARIKSAFVNIHLLKCCNCKSSNILNFKEYVTNCKGYLCKDCYFKTKDNCNTGVYFKCCYCYLYVICFVDFINKKEKLYKEEPNVEKDCIDKITVNSKNIIINNTPIETKLNIKTDININNDKINDVVVYNNSNIIKENNNNISEVYNTTNRKELLSESKIKNKKLIECNIESSDKNCLNNNIKKENYKVSNKNSSLVKDSCSICLEEDPDAVIPCKYKPRHKMHKYCLSNYLSSNYNSCPLCKTNFNS